jgi:hypothetical protein
MTSTHVHRIYRIALVVALSATFIGVTLLVNPIFEGVSPAAETRSGSVGYGELPAVW